MSLSEEIKLKENYQLLLNNQFSYRGYVCNIADTHSGYGGLYFFRSKKEIKRFLPVLIYIYSIIQNDFTLHSEEEIKQLKQLIKVYRNSKWDLEDFDKFIKDTQRVIGYEIIFFKKSRELFNQDSNHPSIRSIQNSFQHEINLDKKGYIDYLNNFYY
jgi:hypothetical protein